MVLVDFWALWCGPCRNFAPTFTAASEKHPEITFAKVDTEAEQALASAAGIRSIPPSWPLCSVCLTLLFLETAFGIYVSCELSQVLPDEAHAVPRRHLQLHAAAAWPQRCGHTATVSSGCRRSREFAAPGIRSAAFRPSVASQ